MSAMSDGVSPRSRADRPHHVHLHQVQSHARGEELQPGAVLHHPRRKYWQYYYALLGGLL